MLGANFRLGSCDAVLAAGDSIILRQALQTEIPMLR